MTGQQPDHVLGGKYELLSKLKEGGMGAVYKVRHRLLDEVRVIKVLRPHLASVEELRERFHREAKIAIQLRHPNIAQLYDFSLDDRGNAYLVMEYIDGVTIRELLDHEGSPSTGLTLQVARQCLKALSYLHRQGFIHRDVAPDNFMLTRDFDGDPLVKIIDLGIAKETQDEVHKTADGVFLGKIRYSAPEQLSRKKGQEIDSRCDLYGFGVMLYELLTGKLPVDGDNFAEIAVGHLFHPPRSFEETDPEGRVTESLRSVVIAALEKEPAARHQTAEAFEAGLAAVEIEAPAADEFDRLLDETVRLVEEGGEQSRRGSTQGRIDMQFGIEESSGMETIHWPSPDLKVVPGSTGVVDETVAVSDPEEAARVAEEARKRAETEAAEKAAREQAEAEARAKVEREAKEKAEREAKEKAQREAKEKAKRLAREKEERQAREKAERAAKEKEKAERDARKKAEREEKEKAKEAAREKARKEAEEKAALKAKEDAEREAKEKAERELRERQEAERKKAEAARLAAEKKKRREESKSLVEKAEALVAEKKLDQALALLGQAVELDGDNAVARTIRARTEKEAARLAAERKRREDVARVVGEVETLVGQGKWKPAEKKVYAAEKSLGKAAEWAPLLAKCSKARESEAAAKLQSLLTKADELSAAGAHRRAARTLNTALGLDPGKAEIKERLARVEKAIAESGSEGLDKRWLWVGGVAALVLVGAVLWLTAGRQAPAEPVPEPTPPPVTAAPVPSADAPPMGRLALDAQPWAEVVAVFDSDGRPVEVGDMPRFTPLVLALPPGEYLLHLSHPSLEEPIEMPVNLSRGLVTRERVEIEVVDAGEYLGRLGFRVE